jgi:hypothetical protein
VKEKLNIKALNTLFPVLGLALLLLLSPCKVRNFIQTKLGAPKTEISNKIKTTISSSSCNTAEISNQISVEKRSISHKIPAILINFAVAFSLTDITKNYTTNHQTRSYSASSIPLYILYQNFKDYL